MKKTLGFVLMLLAMASTALACDCSTLLPLDEEIKETELIVKVKVLEAKFNQRLNQSREYLDSLSHKYERSYFRPALTNQYILLVEKKYKGQVKMDTVMLRTALDPVTDCGLRLEAGKSYLLFAYLINYGSSYYDKESKWQIVSSNRCTRTAVFTEWDEKQLRKSVYIVPTIPE